VNAVARPTIYDVIIFNMPSKQAPAFVPLDPPERSRALLHERLTELGALKTRRFNAEVKAAEKQWEHLTSAILQRAFDPTSANHLKFRRALKEGQSGSTSFQPYGGRPPVGPSPAQEQTWFSARCDALETLLKSLIQELELSIPQAEIKGAYAPGDHYEFYRDLKSIVEKGAKSLFIIDNYLDVQLFDVYMERVSPSVDIRVVTDQLRGPVQAVAQKFASRGQFELRTSKDAHDRHVFVDNRGWVIGQSIKDAAVKKPTYIIELDNPSAHRTVYEQIWVTATPVVKS
jgi:hypothetical protein